MSGVHMGRMMDIERFVKWLYENPQYFQDNVNATNIASTSSVIKWKKYKNLPSISSIKMINGLLPNDEKFEMINIGELLLCVEMAQDHHRGNKLNHPKAITSTGKKVLHIMFGIWDSKALNVRKKEYPELLEYLRSIGKNKNESFDYLPGRTVSIEQLYNVGINYRNKIKNTAIRGGLDNLIENDLVEVVDREKELYKINFEGCKRFIEMNRR
jgi:hypothetical protein